MGTPSRGAVEGIGLGLRMEFADALLERAPEEVSWLEIHPENYMRRGGLYPAKLKRALARWPVVTHGLTMGFGNTDPLDAEYVTGLRALLQDVGTPWHSDHMCFGGAGAFVHDLLPLPFTEEVLAHMAARFTEARERLGIELAFENLSYYVAPGAPPLEEAAFARELLARADAKMLLDVNNVYVNARNHGFDARAWIDQIPAERVVQIHVAGHLVRDDGLRIDTHAEPVPDDVYALLEYTLTRMGPRPVLLERDGNWPALDELLAEVRHLSAIYERAKAAYASAAKNAGAGDAP